MYFQQILRAIQDAVVGSAYQWQVWLPALVGMVAVWLLLPRPTPRPWYQGALAGGLAMFLTASLLLKVSGVSPEVVLFYAFSALAIVGGAMLVTQHNPARAALSFTLVILSSCGLFLLLGAPFLMAATIIIYAGAIIVTFLFVLMLASQAGLSDADARSREPALATFTGFLLLATILYVLKGYSSPNAVDDLIARADRALVLEAFEEMSEAVAPEQSEEARKREDYNLFRKASYLLAAAGLRDESREARGAAENWRTYSITLAGDERLQQSRALLESFRKLLADNRDRASERLTTARLDGVDTGTSTLPPMSNLSGPPPTTPFREFRRDGAGRPELPAENAGYLGRSLFTDYLLPVEIGGTLLLVATIGAIAIAQRRDAGRPTP